MPSEAYNIHKIDSLIIDCHNLLIDILLLKTNLINNELCGVNNEDLRINCFMKLAQIAQNFKLSMIFCRESLLVYDWWDRHGYSNLTNEQKMENASSYWDQIPFSTFQSMFSVVEATLRQIIFSIDSTAVNEATGNFSKIQEELYKHLSIGETEHTSHKSYFDLLSAIRNTIHNNGVYRNKSKPENEIEHKGIKYQFKHQHPPNCITAKFLLDMLKQSSEVLKDIITDDTVSRLDEVEDLYKKLGSYETIKLD